MSRDSMRLKGGMNQNALFSSQPIHVRDELMYILSFLCSHFVFGIHDCSVGFPEKVQVAGKFVSFGQVDASGTFFVVGMRESLLCEDGGEVFLPQISRIKQNAVYRILLLPVFDFSCRSIRKQSF